MARLADTFTLLRTLPTLCSTLVATSAMPACREASISAFCTLSILASMFLRAEISSRKPTELTGTPSGVRTIAAVTRTHSSVPSRFT